METLLLLQCTDFAATKHRLQKRKDALDPSQQTPYINHPIGVARILAGCGVTDIDTLLAALLHDTIEDTDTTAHEISMNFGPTVARIVQECTDNKALDKVTRKQAQLEHAQHISSEARYVKQADKYYNCRDLIRNPPAKWSDEEVRGCLIWSHAVIQRVRGQNANLDSMCDRLFQGANMPTTDVEQAEALEAYYKVLNHSE